MTVLAVIPRTHPPHLPSGRTITQLPIPPSFPIFALYLRLRRESGAFGGANREGKKVGRLSCKAGTVETCSDLEAMVLPYLHVPQVATEAFALEATSTFPNSLTSFNE